MLNYECTGQSPFLAVDYEIARVYVDPFWEDRLIESNSKFLSLAGEIGGAWSLALALVTNIAVMVFTFRGLRRICCKKSSQEKAVEAEENAGGESKRHEANSEGEEQKQSLQTIRESEPPNDEKGPDEDHRLK